MKPAVAAAAPTNSPVQDDALVRATQLHAKLATRNKNDAAGFADGLASLAQIALTSSNTKTKLGVATLLLDWLDLALELVLKVLSSVAAIPAPHTADETVLLSSLGEFLRKLWTAPLQFSPQSVMAVLTACLTRFGARFVGSDTFEYDGYLHTGSRLGKGVEGDVHLGFHQASGRVVAIKSIRRAVFDRPGLVEKLNRGIDFMRSADHPSIVKLYHVARTDNCWYLYMEYIDGGDLQTYMRKARIVAEPKAKELFRKMLLPISYLRGKQVAHRDLKPSNFMCTRAGDVKLVDFATMHEGKEEENLTQTFVGTPMYMAPEVWKSDRRAYKVEKVDVWSLGVILYELLCGRVPFRGETVQQYVDSIVASSARQLEVPEGLSAEVRDLLQRALQVNPTARLSWSELVNHAWLAEDAFSSRHMTEFTDDAVLRLELQVAELEAKCKAAAETVVLKDRLINNLMQELASIDSKLPAAQQETANRRMVKLQETCEALTRRVAQLQEEAGRAAQSAADVVSARQRIATLEGELAGLADTRERCAALEGRLAGVAQAVSERDEAAQRAVVEARALLARAEADRATLQERCAALEAQLQSAGASVTRYSGEAAALAQARAALEEQVATAKAEETRLLDQVAQREALRADAVEAGARAAAENAALRQQLEQARAQVQRSEASGPDLRARVAELEARCAVLDTLVSDAAKAEPERARVAAARDDELAFVRSQLVTRDAELERAVAEAQLCIAREASLKEKVLASTRQVVLLNDRVSVLERERAASEGQMRTAAAETKEAATRETAAVERAREAEAKLARIEAELLSQQSLMDDMLRRSGSADVEHGAKDAELRHLVEQLAAAQDALERTRASEQQLMSDCAGLVRAKEAAERALAAQRAEHDQLVSEMVAGHEQLGAETAQLRRDNATLADGMRSQAETIATLELLYNEAREARE